MGWYESQERLAALVADAETMHERARPADAESVGLRKAYDEIDPVLDRAGARVVRIDETARDEQGKREGFEKATAERNAAIAECAGLKRELGTAEGEEREGGRKPSGRRQLWSGLHWRENKGPSASNVTPCCTMWRGLDPGSN